jgi:hypothetical protein
MRRRPSAKGRTRAWGSDHQIVVLRRSGTKGVVACASAASSRTLLLGPATRAQPVRPAYALSTESLKRLRSARRGSAGHGTAGREPGPWANAGADGRLPGCRSVRRHPGTSRYERFNAAPERGPRSARLLREADADREGDTRPHPVICRATCIGMTTWRCRGRWIAAMAGRCTSLVSYRICLPSLCPPSAAGNRGRGRCRPFHPRPQVSARPARRPGPAGQDVDRELGTGHNPVVALGGHDRRFGAAARERKRRGSAHAASPEWASAVHNGSVRRRSRRSVAADSEHGASDLRGQPTESLYKRSQSKTRPDEAEPFCPPGR